MVLTRRAVRFARFLKHCTVKTSTVNDLCKWEKCIFNLDKRAFSTTRCVRLYDNAFSRSTQQPDEYWAEAAEQITWHKKWTKVLDDSNSPFTKWFVDGELNICYNAVDRHVESGHGERTAIIHDSPVTKSIQKITFKELKREVEKFAGVLRKYGVEKGDRVLIYMPMIPEAVVAMLACARLGAIHSLVFGGFASKELATRIHHSEAKVVVSANCGVEPSRVVPYKPMLDEAINLSEFKPQKCIIYNRPGFEAAAMTPGMDVSWQEEMTVDYSVDCVPVSAMDPLYLLYTSGTTGLPKAVVRPTGGYAVNLKWSMYSVYGMNPGDVWWAASDLGWVVGHSYIAYAPLLNNNTTIIFEGKPVGTPDAGTFFRLLQEHGVNGMFTAPTALRAIRAEDPEGKLLRQYLPLENFRTLFVAGEHMDPETMMWIQEIIKKPILDNWWQTETGSPITSTCVGLGMQLYPPSGVAGKPVPGWNVKVLREDGSETEPEELGQIAVKLPLPPGSFSTLWMADQRFRETYFTKIPGYYDTMDAGFRDENGYIAVMARSDDVINVAGHRISAGALEEAILECEDVVESAVIGVPDSLKGQIPVGICIIRQGLEKAGEDVIRDVIQAVREKIGPVAAFKKAVIVPKLPKTRSGKVARNTMAAMAANKPYKIPATIEDASVYPQIKAALQTIGYATGD
ncbi:acyl-CoA synthetase short-chain family member 3, mitochondrial-like [Haliotis rufescens]|uniref:acyl-CoA synthetase short-chain family member 3, mitochondrial-like n=1 Tax=Haliotis rufescens TaxID=6454 RepID=UPI00201F5257|nr:acyl-CoA synthetase short-chain family member 3, mitochondrial-like [Haliotis rufescens]